MEHPCMKCYLEEFWGGTKTEQKNQLLVGGSSHAVENIFSNWIISHEGSEWKSTQARDFHDFTMEHKSDAHLTCTVSQTQHPIYSSNTGNSSKMLGKHLENNSIGVLPFPSFSFCVCWHFWSDISGCRDWDGTTTYGQTSATVRWDLCHSLLVDKEYGLPSTTLSYGLDEVTFGVGTSMTWYPSGLKWHMDTYGCIMMHMVWYV